MPPARVRLMEQNLDAAIAQATALIEELEGQVWRQEANFGGMDAA
jgi:hypothetical protein